LGEKKESISNSPQYFTSKNQNQNQNLGPTHFFLHGFFRQFATPIESWSSLLPFIFLPIDGEDKVRRRGQLPRGCASTTVAGEAQGRCGRPGSRAQPLEL
jgi:hypothetical protein